MKVVDTIQECCEVGLGVMDGKYGWLAEALTLLGIVIIFNFLAKILLRRLHMRYDRQHKIWKDSFVKALYKPMSYLVWFIVISNSIDVISLRVAQKNFFNISFMHLMIKLASIFAFGWFLFRWKANAFQIMLAKSKNREVALEQGKVDMMGKVATLVIIIAVGLLLLEATHSNMSTLIAFGGLGGLAFAFASQKIIANFFSGFMIYLTQPFTIGDWVNLPERSIEGHVEEIGWYMTRVRTFEKRPIYIPNAIFSEVMIMTPSRMSHRPIKETVGIRYKDMPVLKAIAHDIKVMLKEHSGIDTKQRILVYLQSFGSYSLDLLVDAYTHKIGNEDFSEVKQDILFKIADIIAYHGAEMAYPMTTVDIPDGVFIKRKELA